MPLITVYVDDLTNDALAAASRELGRPVEDLAEAAISEAVLKWESGRPQQDPNP